MSNPRVISARLTTLCGCSKIVWLREPLTPVLEEAIVVRISPEGGEEILYRKFRLRNTQPPAVAVEADYEEIPA